MIEKLLPTICVAVFGALMFAAGASAPDSVRTALMSLGAGPAPGALKIPAAAGKPRSPAPPPAGAPVPAPVLAETLLVDTPAPPNARYALMAGQLASAGAADALSRRVRQSHLPALPYIHVVDRAGINTVVVAVGPYATLADARLAREPVGAALDLVQPPPVIMLPPAAR